MLRRTFAAVICASALAGCATYPVQQFDQISVADVEERIKCELGTAYNALHPRHPEIITWSAGLTLTLAVDSTGSLTPSTSLLGPFGSIHPIDLSAGITGNTKRTALLKVYFSFEEAVRHKCPPPGSSPLQGSLGLSDWVIRVFDSQDQVAANAARVNPMNRGDPIKASVYETKEKAIGYSLDFAVTASFGATPNYVISVATAKSPLSLESKSTNSIDLAMIGMTSEEFHDRFDVVRLPKKKKKVDGKFVEELIRPRVQPRSPPHGEIDPNTKNRLDDILQELQLRTLLPRR